MVETVKVVVRVVVTTILKVVVDEVGEESKDVVHVAFPFKWISTNKRGFKMRRVEWMNGCLFDFLGD